MKTPVNSLPPAVGPGHSYPAHDRTEYRSERGIAAFWPKDGLWHLALPAPDIVDGLRTSGFLWTGDGFNSKSEAVTALWKNTPIVEVTHTLNPENLRVGYVGENTIGASIAADAPGTLFVASIFDEVTLRRIGRTYGKTEQEAKANAAFIVHACNTSAAHEARIAALVGALEQLKGETHNLHLREIVRAALALAKSP